MEKPLCFVLMPFGQKPDGAGATVNFDAVYKDLIKPAVEAAGMEPIRADEELAGGMIHKPMFERLILCEYAVADLTTANANVFYELGVRHTARPWSTVLLFAGQSRLPFDVAPLRAMPYKLTPAGAPDDLDGAKAALVERLEKAKADARAFKEGGGIDSPVFQLVDGFPNIVNQLDHTKTDVFRERCEYAAKMKERLTGARKQNVGALRAIEKELGDLGEAEAGVLIDLFLSYRAVKAWAEMIALVNKMPAPLAATVMVQEQLAFALNRNGQSEDAERVLVRLIDQRGPSAETCGLLGRVYKDRWEAAVKGGDKFAAAGLLDQAIDTYARGFQADWRDAYPGINAVTLMTLRNPPDQRRDPMLPVVSYAVEQRIAGGKPDYWDYATRLELAVLAKDRDRAMKAAGDALAHLREAFEPETTARNLRLIREARAERSEALDWAGEIEQALERKGKELEEALKKPGAP
jgi:tetratricopeptide (TPR) repeat protein